MKIKTCFLTLIVILVVGSVARAQAPDGINYQAVVRNGSGDIIQSQLVNMRFSIRTGTPTGNVQYQESKTLTTNQYGLVNHVIGTGTVITGTFSTITWNAGKKYLQVELDNGSGYVDLGTTQFVSVPFALQAANAENAINATNATNATNASNAANATNATTATTALDNHWNVSGSDIYSNNSGSVGIGGTPSSKLYVQSPAGLDALRIRVNGTTRLFMDDGGGLSVGTQTAAPPAGLKVASDAQLDANLSVTGISSLNGGVTVNNGANFNNGLTVNGGTTLNGGYAVMCSSQDNSQGNVGMGFGGYGNVKLSVKSNQAFAVSIEGADLIVDGNIGVSGSVNKAGGSFKIDHPLDPANKYLYHSFVESPDMMNVYNGNIVTDGSGIATVELPDYFEALNKDFRYQLTVIGTFAQAIVKEKVNNNRFVIQTDKPNTEVSWQVTGIRHDAYAEKHRIPTSVDKVGVEKGKYQNPDCFGLSDEYSAIKAKLIPASTTK